MKNIPLQKITVHRIYDEMALKSIFILFSLLTVKKFGERF
jgi:hypothetical protein